MIHVLVLNRYTDEFSDYQKYIDHEQIQVSYIFAPGCDTLIDQSKSHMLLEVPEYMNKPENIFQAAVDLHQKHPIDRLIAYSEFDMDIAAQIRTELNIPGADNTETALFRDKVRMKQALQGSGIPYPQFQQIDSRKEALAFIEEYDFPVIVKPITGASSEGVVEINKLEDLEQVESFSKMQIEQFITGDILHIDGIVAQGNIPYFKASQYINTCLAFRLGTPLGSYTIDDEATNEILHGLTLKILQALTIEDRAFHLELIHHQDEYYFLEIGGRVGGGEIPFITQNAENIDLFQLWTDASLGESMPNRDIKKTGFLMFPNPYPDGFRFDEEFKVENELVIFQHLKYLQEENNGFSYEDIPARVHFVGDKSEDLERAIRQTIEQISKAIKPNTEMA